MKANIKKYFQLILIGLLLISFISMTLCTGDDNGDDDGNGDENGENGNGNGDNNTTNDEKGIKFVEVHHTPDTPTIDDKIQFNVKIESENPIEAVNLIVCESSGVCFAAEKMTETPPNSNEYYHEWTIPSGITSGEVLTYHITVKDSLDNVEESKDYEIIVS